MCASTYSYKSGESPTQLQSELNRQPTFAGLVPEQFSGAGHPLQHCVAVRVQALGRPRRVLRLLEEYPECLA